MREGHPLFHAPSDESATVWRHFDFPKFASFVQTGTLFFSRADQLGDPFEGSFSRATAVARDRAIADAATEDRGRQLRQIFDQWSRMHAEFTQRTYINCWHLGDHESMAMWRGYGGGPYGVAIRSTFAKLSSSLPEGFTPVDRLETIYVGCVRYVDLLSETEVVSEHNAYNPFLHKFLPYQHESEVRATFTVYKPGSEGYAVPLVGDIQSLVTHVVVSPLAPRWFEEVVRRTCLQADVPLEIAPSVLSASPVF